MNAFHRILVATDFTDASAPAVEKGLELAKDNHSELMIAYACERPNMSQAEAIAPAVYDEWKENLRTQAEERIRPLVEDAIRQGVDAKALVLEGDPEKAIPEAARDEAADLVVMGTHARHGLSRFFQGSVAAHVITASPCPVLTVHGV